MALALEGPDDLPLLVGDHSAKHSVLPHGRGDVLIRLELPGVHPLLCVPDACLGRHSGDGHRVVAGDDLHIHALGVEVIEDFGSVGADGILQHQQGQGDHHAVEAPDLRPVALGQQQYPAALGGVGGSTLFQGGEVLPQDILRCAHHISPPVQEIHGAPLGGGGEGHGSPVRPAGPPGKLVRDGLRRVVIRIQHPVKGTQNVGDVRLGTGLRVQGHHLPHLHLRTGDGAGLVHAQHVHPGQGLDGVHLVDQRPILGQPHHADRQGHGSQQEQPLRDHADQGRHRADHGLLQAQILIDELVVEQRCADGNQHDADEADQAVQGAHHLAFAGAVIFLGRQRQLGGVGVCSHLVHPGPALAGDDEAAGQQLVPRLLGDGVRLAGDEGLVHLHLPGEDRSVRRDLAAGGELYYVLPHQLVHRQLPDLSVPNDPHLRGGEEGQLLNGAFGAQLLDDADDGIGCHDEEEGHVLPVPYQQQAHRQNHENQVEVGEDILPDDLLIAFGGRLHRAVVPAGLRQGLSLGGGEAAVRLGGTAGHLLAASGRGLRGGRFPVRFHGHSSFDKI